MVPVLDGLSDYRTGAPEVYAIHRCQQCGAEQTLPRLEPAAIQRLRRHRQPADRTAANTSRFRDWLSRGRLHRLWLRLDGDLSFQLVRGRGRLLAVGCPDSRSLERYRANGFAVEGWSDDRRAAAEMRAAGFTVHGGDPTDDLAQFQPNTSYDVIVLANVLPWSRDPRATFREFNRCLAPGGELWISLPNNTSLFREMFGRYWTNWHVPFNAVHYAPNTLRYLLTESGFLVREMRCVTPALWLTQSILLALYSRPGKPTDRLDKPILLAGWMLVLRGFFFPTLFFLNRALRGDCLLVRARRRAG